MKQFLAKSVFYIDIEDKNAATQFDEQWRIIQAKQVQEAFMKATSIGKREETTFVNENNKQVSWRFVDITQLFPLNRHEDGEQLFSATVEASDKDGFIKYIREKSMLIQIKSSLHL
jgi:Domain of unknown function (DUF4288)